MKHQILILPFVIIVACSTKTDNGTEQTLDQKNQIKDDIQQIEEEEDTYEILNGERIDGPANVRNKENGKIILSLDDNALIETSPIKGDWLQIGFFIQIGSDEGSMIKLYPEEQLKTTDGSHIGKVKDTVEVWRIYDNVGLIEGFTHIGNIKENSIPETALEIALKRGVFTKSFLDKYIKSFEFSEYELNQELNYRQLFIYESYIVDPSPRDRITLLFDNYDKLIGIFHTRKLHLPDYETFELTRGHSFTCIEDLDKSEKQRIIHERIKFYNSVD
ncbi:hypothetical protein [Cyclobacterium marinum]|uniref:hypothetical protein n=1 Tax=Cyclobacterium marinum TaxID=104 RepID=UPI0018DC098D|nr:hypothetical protein [Cyclobacterium marinum]MBI0400574.1 hypothetical protein [Cyclobacterium marinum]